MSSSRLKVLLVAPLPPPTGGIAMWTERVVAYSKQCSEAELKVVDSAPRGRSIHEKGIWPRSRAGVAALRTQLKELSAQAKSWSPDVVHLTTSGSLGLLRDVAILHVARKHRIPCVYHIRFGRVPELEALGNVEWKLLRWAVARADVTLVLDQTTERVLRSRVPAARIERLPNPVEVAVPRGKRAAADRTVLFAGHVVQSKGVDELIGAWSSLGVADWCLIIAGSHDGSYPMVRIRELGCAETVEVVGELERSRLVALMEESSILVLPSHSEGFPNVVLEAMSRGMAVIGTSVGAIPEMLAGDCGVVIKPNDQAALGLALRTLTNDPQLRHFLGRNARKKAGAQYSMGAVFSQYVALWRSLTSSENPE